MGANARTTTSAPLLRSIAATPAARADDESPCDRWRTVALPDVAYLFVRSAVAANPPLIAEPWTCDYLWPAKTVFVRSVSGTDVLRAGAKTLRALQRQLPARFVQIQRCLMVNTDAITELDLGGGSINQIGIHAGRGVEYLPVSRRATPLLRRLFAYPLRVKRRRRGRAPTSPARATRPPHTPRR